MELKVESIDLKNEWTIVKQDVNMHTKISILPSSNLSAQECTLVNTMSVRSISDNKKNSK